MENTVLLQCYNRGCGQKYKENENSEDLCRHHPGQPFFHDAYKGWSCCNKKCTDFTEFLNTKGCTIGKHSNIKPPEPQKPEANIVDEIIEVKPIVKDSLKRPPFKMPMTLMTAEIAPSLLELPDSNVIISNENEKKQIAGVSPGTLCKNSGCNITFEGPETDLTDCIHHPGYPVFHEGLKFWTCCTKRTSDFNAFLSQVGCDIGKHIWIKEIINVKTSAVKFYGTKVEIKLRKAEAGSWSNLDIPRKIKVVDKVQDKIEETLTSRVEAVDLSDL